MAIQHTYDKALYRLITIITMLINDERPTIIDLSLEFNVSVRTIQTDIYRRLNGFPIEKDSLGRLKLNKGFGLGYKHAG